MCFGFFVLVDSVICGDDVHLSASLLSLSNNFISPLFQGIRSTFSFYVHVGL